MHLTGPRRRFHCPRWPGWASETSRRAPTVPDRRRPPLSGHIIHLPPRRRQLHMRGTARRGRRGDLGSALLSRDATGRWALACPPRPQGVRRIARPRPRREPTGVSALMNTCDSVNHVYLLLVLSCIYQGREFQKLESGRLFQ
uniref:Uncharacterized protein n=1 Tax=Triticum urartu TaxID=4572 RepID=A0A8R7UAP6_TRIUA